ncbi:MAG: hypothetical protein WDN00_18680 [Limisphaerales bacterium]
MEVSGAEEAHYLLSDPNKILAEWLVELIAYFQALWLVSDHAVSPGVSYCIFKHPEHGMASGWSYATGSTTALGMQPVSTCSAKSLNLASEYFSTLIHYTFSELWKKAEPDAKYKLGSAKGVPRLYRFFYFLSGARHADDLAIKISLYITCLEILFSTSAAEIVHKLSERVAFFLERSPRKENNFPDS